MSPRNQDNNMKLTSIKQGSPSRGHLELVFQNLPIAVFTIDNEGRITTWNHKAAQLTGYLAEEVLGWTSDLFRDAGKDLTSPRPQDTNYVTEAQETVIRRKDGQFRVVLRKTDLLRDETGLLLGGLESLEDLTASKQAHAELLKIQTALNDASDAILITDLTGTVTYVNMAFNPMFMHTLVSINEKGLNSIFQNQGTVRQILDSILGEESWNGEVQMVSSKGRSFTAFLRATPIWGEELSVGPTGILLFINDVTDRKNLEGQLLQAQKLKAIGQLAAGIAHEINTPMQYVGDNTRFLKDGFGNLLGLLEHLTALVQAVRENRLDPDMLETVQTAMQGADLEFLSSEIPTALNQSLEGIGRVSEIVRAMKEFSHPNDLDKTEIPINEAIQNTIIVARNEWKYVADLETDLDPNLPPVPCLRGEFNQVILNLLVNAAQAIEAKVGRESGRKGRITVSTRRDGDWAEIRVADSGTGIAPEIRNRIFDPFFTTKEVGKGTGQGLTISYAVIVEKHQGKLSFETEVDQGTVFIIRLPLHPSTTGSSGGHSDDV